MNKHLNNWLDRVEGLKQNYSNNNIAKEIARQRGETNIKPTFNKVISIDFDGTICKKQKYGDGLIYQTPIPGAKKFMDKLKADGYRIVILTVRMSPDKKGNLLWKKYQLESWLGRYNIPYHEITNNKPDADLYIDDKALRFTDWKSAEKSFNKLFN